jgi:hypothetical protein
VGCCAWRLAARALAARAERTGGSHTRVKVELRGDTGSVGGGTREWAKSDE